MKRMGLLILFLFPSLLCAQDTPDAHPFWDQQNLYLHVLNFTAQSLDAYSTQRFLERGTAREMNPLARPFVTQGWKGQAPYSYGLGFVLPLGLSCIAHRKRWHRLERMIPLVWATPTAVVAGLNFRF